MDERINIMLPDEDPFPPDNDLVVYELEGGVCISVFEFECVLGREATAKLRDFLSVILQETNRE